MTVDPQNMVLYLAAEARDDEALAAAARFAHLASNSQLERSDSYSLWSNMTRGITGDIRRSQALAQVSTAIDSRTVAPNMELLHDAQYLGHDEEALRQARIISAKRMEDETPEFQKVGFGYTQELGRFALDTELGDFTQATQETCEFLCTPARALSRRAEYFARLHDPAKARALLAEARAMDTPHDVQTERARYFTATATSDWHSAIAAAHDYEGDERFTPPGQTPTPRFNDTLVRTLVDPLLAVALARSGDIDAARAAIASSPLDCYDCLRVRGVVEGLAKNWTAAASWFARATKVAPSIPFAFADWGEMLMRKGDLDGALAKFTIASQKGPHFADPLEMWGEALIAKNRSDLALAKFEEAAKDAPNWGSLHLKWGEALWWSGDHAGARNQLAIAAHLDLTSPEKSELARTGTSRGR
jgi:tetratricopeptide (TPR) repeat protein